MAVRPLRVLRGAVILGLLVLVVIAWVIWSPPEAADPPPALRALRSDLDLREDQRLYLRDATTPFSGLLIENFPGKGLKLEIEIHEGKVHGRSRGWFENGQLEVEETFLDGVSNGRRRRWFANGRKRSEAGIVGGKLEGPYLEWHQNGGRAVEMSMKQGVPDGISRTWYPSGARKSEVEHASGKIVGQQSWPDAGEEAAAAEPIRQE